jgi:aminopeptidase N
MEETDLDDHTRVTHWKQSVPIATWLYALAVARFAVQYVDTFDGTSIQTWVYPQDRDAGFYDFAVPTKHALEFYSDWVGPFAYEKLANIQSNSVGGGMEAATAIFYGDQSVTGERSVRWRNVIIHEVAHQWFGNAVTESAWDDVWLSEGFATYFTLLFIEHAYGLDEFVQGLKDSQRRVNDFYTENPDYCIVHDNLDDMSKVTTSQTYQKGSWILHMLRGVVGDEAFWKGIQSYYTHYMNDHATTDDFRREMEAASGRDLAWFFEQWLYKGGTLKLQGDWTYDGQSRSIQINLSQVQNDSYLFRMPIPVGIYYEGDPQPRIETVEVSAETHTFTLSAEREPERLVLDPDTRVLLEAEFERRP